ncbi:MAG TPA: hypothetical protein VM489_13375 [Burkholderiales bacterium]|nr:hypothetical protein [Burkholderiales bacterium]
MRLLAALAAACALGSAAAAPFGVQLGDARLVLDSPPGFADTTFTGSPRLQELAEALTSASNRILLFAISDADLRRFSQGDPPEFRRYMLVATPRVYERERLPPGAFQRLAEDALRGFTPPPPETDVARHLESQPVGLSTALVQIRRDPDVLSLLYGTRLEPTKMPRFLGTDIRQNYVLASSTLLLVRGKALALSVFSLYESPDDAAWIRAVTERWIAELQRMNRP